MINQTVTLKVIVSNSAVQAFLTKFGKITVNLSVDSTCTVNRRWFRKAVIVVKLSGEYSNVEKVLNQLDHMYKYGF